MATGHARKIVSDDQKNQSCAHVTALHQQAQSNKSKSNNIFVFTIKSFDIEIRIRYKSLDQTI